MQRKEINQRFKLPRLYIYILWSHMKTPQSFGRRASGLLGENCLLCVHMCMAWEPSVQTGQWGVDMEVDREVWTQIHRFILKNRLT